MSSLYDFVFENNDEIAAFSVLNSHRILDKYAPYPDGSWVFRVLKKVVTDSTFELTECKQIISTYLF